MLSADERDAFDERLALARTVFPYVENHNFYIDHRYFTIFWNKVREFGSLLSRHRFLEARDDVFYLRHDEVRSALEELRLHWSAGGVGAVSGPTHWPPIVARRKSILEAMRSWPAPPALGKAPEEITDPITIMLWGITTERVQAWLAPTAATERVEPRISATRTTIGSSSLDRWCETSASIVACVASGATTTSRSVARARSDNRRARPGINQQGAGSHERKGLRSGATD